MKKSKLMKAGFSMYCLFILSQNGYAQTTAKEGLDRLQNNISNSEKNVEDYKKNLQVVDGNINEISKVKKKLESQKTEIKSTLSENNKILNDYKIKSAELEKLSNDEKNKKDLEAKKVIELQAMIDQLQKNQEQRTKNIQSYQDQKLQLETDKKEFEARSEKLAKIAKDLDGQMKNTNDEETKWKAKKKGYEGEVTRWSNEIDKQKKLQTEVQALVDAH